MARVSNVKNQNNMFFLSKFLIRRWRRSIPTGSQEEKEKDEKDEKEEGDEKEETEMRLFETASRSLMCRINIMSGSAVADR